MAFADSASIVVLSKLGSDWEILSAVPECPDWGWDTLTVVAIKDYGGVPRTRAEVLAEWPIGRRPLAGENFWTTSRTAERVGGNIWKLDVIARGSTGQRPLRHRVGSSASTVTRTGQNIQVVLQGYNPTSGQISAVNIRVSSPVLDVSYVLIGTAPDTSRIGRYGPAYQTPPINIAVRPPVAMVSGTPIELNLPSGWNLDAYEADPLAGTDTPVALISETWIYQQVVSDT